MERAEGRSQGGESRKGVGLLMMLPSILPTSWHRLVSSRCCWAVMYPQSRAKSRRGVGFAVCAVTVRKLAQVAHQLCANLFVVHDAGVVDEDTPDAGGVRLQVAQCARLTSSQDTPLSVPRRTRPSKRLSSASSTATITLPHRSWR